MDSSLRILQIQGEGCGAYCNPFWETYFILMDKEGEIDRVYEDMNNCSMTVQEIHMLGSGRVLLIGYSSGRPRGVESNWGYRALIYTFGNEPELIWKQDALTSNLVSDTIEPIGRIEFNDSLLILDYTYDWYEENPYSTYRVNGRWRLEEFYPIQEFEDRQVLTD